MPDNNEIQDLWPDDLLEPQFDKNMLEKRLCDILSYGGGISGDDWRRKVYEMFREIIRQMEALDRKQNK